ncbi:MAG: RdgB/HAM1 family non-canonical purine NTP pyrophosphatase [Verrucomicrobia bacterium]|nr:RdgB/HAM1 family non-canonical purine NTP pyrophosphatase [Verrucomicrobiota bacterium]
MDLMFATRNRHKTRELAQLLGPDYAVRDLTGEYGAPEIDENGSTFLENARIKARTISRYLPQQIVIADDSGLIVDALGGAPGVFSARYAGAQASDAENIAKLLRELDRCGHTESPARFVCAIVLAINGRIMFATQGEAAGRIIRPPHGTNGFGYDPVFIPAGFEKTFGELPNEVKNNISHRAAAARKVRLFLQKSGIKKDAAGQ